VCTCDQAASRIAPSSDPPVISARPPCRSSHRPTGTASAAEVSTETVKAPVIAPVEARRSAAIGTRNTAKA
jgi:hypothetical protein